jgi:hypothetical protein
MPSASGSLSSTEIFCWLDLGIFPPLKEFDPAVKDIGAEDLLAAWPECSSIVWSSKMSRDLKKVKNTVGD